MPGSREGQIGSDPRGETYRRTVEAITAYCGGEARAVLLVDDGRFPAGGVLELAGRSPEDQRHGLRRAAAGDPRPLKRIGDCLVDVGNTHDPRHLLFDHKPPAFPDRHDACAARLV